MYILYCKLIIIKINTRQNRNTKLKQKKGVGDCLEGRARSALQFQYKYISRLYNFQELFLREISELLLSFQRETNNDKDNNNNKKKTFEESTTWTLREDAH